MNSRILLDEIKFSRNLSWNQPVKRYYSDIGMIECNSCHRDVNIRDLIQRNGKIICKVCKGHKTSQRF
jgi:formylmethanofuran dehydrogenase subunit E